MAGAIVDVILRIDAKDDGAAKTISSLQGVAAVTLRSEEAARKLESAELQLAAATNRLSEVKEVYGRKVEAAQNKLASATEGTKSHQAATLQLANAEIQASNAIARAESEILKQTAAVARLSATEASAIQAVKASERARVQAVTAQAAAAAQAERATERLANSEIRAATATRNYGQALEIVQRIRAQTAPGSQRYNDLLAREATLQRQAATAAQTAATTTQRARAQTLAQSTAAARATQQVADSEIRAAAASRNYSLALNLVDRELAQTTVNSKRYNDLLARQAQLQRQSESAAKGGSGVLGDLSGEVLGLAGAYGALGAAQQAYGFVKEGGNVNATAASFTNLAASVGLSAEKLRTDLRAASAGTVSDLSLMRTANKALIGDSVELAQQLPRLLEIARASAGATGLSVEESFDRIVSGVRKAEPEVLDELGIVFNLTKVYDAYAESLGKTARELTDQEKLQARLNAVLQQGNTIIENTGNSSGVAGQALTRLEVRLKNFKDEVAGLAAIGTEEVLSGGKFSGEQTDAIILSSAKTYEEYTAAADEAAAAQGRVSASTIEASAQYGPLGFLVGAVAGTYSLLASETRLLSEEQFAYIQALKAAGAPQAQAQKQAQDLTVTSELLAGALKADADGSKLSAEARRELVVQTLLLADNNEQTRESVLSLATAFAFNKISLDELKEALLALQLQQQVGIGITQGLAAAKREATLATTEFTGYSQAELEVLAANTDNTLAATLAKQNLALAEGEAAAGAASAIEGYRANSDSLRDMEQAAYRANDAVTLLAISLAKKQFSRDDLKDMGIDPRDQAAVRDFYANQAQSIVDEDQTEANNKANQQAASAFNAEQARQRQLAEQRRREAERLAKQRQSEAEREAERRLRDAEREAEAVAKAEDALRTDEEKLKNRQDRLAAGGLKESERLTLEKEILDLNKKITEEREKQYKAALDLRELLLDDQEADEKALKRLEQAQAVLRSDTASAEQKRAARRVIDRERLEDDQRAYAINEKQQAAGAGGAIPVVPVVQTGAGPVAVLPGQPGAGGPGGAVPGGALPGRGPTAMQMMQFSLRLNLSTTIVLPDGRVLFQAVYPYMEETFVGGMDAAWDRAIATNALEAGGLG